MEIPVAQYILRRLRQHDVEALFGVPAVFCSPLFNAADTAADFRTVVTNSDLEAGYAADGYARVRGLAAVAVSNGPGVLSIVNAVAGAYIERSPVVVINGGPSEEDLRDQAQTGVVYSHSMGRPSTDMDVFRQITAFCAREPDRLKIPHLVDTAIRTALTTKHPVYIEIPKDVFRAACPEPDGVIDLTVAPGAADTVAARIRQEIRSAANPVVIVGEEIARYRLASKVSTFLDAQGVRWATTVVGKTVLPESHPRFLGVFNGDKAPQALRDTIRNAGVIVSLGAVFGSGHAAIMEPLVRAGKVIRIWDGSAVVRGDAPQAVGLPSLVDGLVAVSAADSPITYPAAAPVAAAPSPAAVAELDYQEVFDVVGEPAFLDGSMTVIADTSLGIFPAVRMRLPAQDSFISSGIWASIGHSVGAAVGVWSPGGRRPLVLIGDGGFQMMGQSVSTMVRYGHTTIVVVIDNSLYGYEQYLLGPAFYTDPAIAPLPYNVLPDWDFAAFAQSLGVTRVATVDSAAGLRSALAAAKTHTSGPSVIRAKVGTRSLPAGL